MARAHVVRNAGGWRIDTLARLRSDTRGAALVEFAFTLPILMLIIVGIFDFGFLFRDYQVITNAAREGARMAVLPGYQDADVQARVLAYASAGGVTATPVPVVSAATLTTAGGTTFTTKRVTVTLPHTFTFLAPFATIFGGGFGTIELTAISEMRTEVGAGG